jgi:hypothetical protein
VARILQRVFAVVLLGVLGIQVRAENDLDTQHALIDQALAGYVVEPAQAGRVFFLGFAGYGEERVFAEEIKLAAERVAARLGTVQRSVLLINDRRDLTAWPLATHENLRYALREIGRRMDPATDVLFLLLSSHGVREGMIEVSNVGMPALGLSGEALRILLDDARITHKVVVVSACYSGTFIEPLADEHSIVITAASATRTSFGCSDDRHLTYFGEAFFRDALPGARTLREAFETARESIAHREKKERFTPSEPQSHFGPAAESLVDGLLEKEGPAPDR